MSLAAYHRILAITNLRSVRALTGDASFLHEGKSHATMLSTAEMRLVRGGDGVSAPKGGWSYAVSTTTTL
jgi:hypothetical protein